MKILERTIQSKSGKNYRLYLQGQVGFDKLPEYCFPTWISTDLKLQGQRSWEMSRFGLPDDDVVCATL